MMNQGITTLPLSPTDTHLVEWVLYTAVSWNNPPDLPPLAEAIQHPELLRYHVDWGRPGDIGVRAAVDGEFAGAAVARLFTDRDHGYGYLDEDTPELGIAVVPGLRGRGVGRALLDALAEEARTQGFNRLSLSVNNPNPAKRLYESAGFAEIDDDGESALMVLEL
jgi:GNAT superfamily N-acetyltransferase